MGARRTIEVGHTGIDYGLTREELEDLEYDSFNRHEPQARISREINLADTEHRHAWQDFMSSFGQKNVDQFKTRGVGEMMVVYAGKEELTAMLRDKYPCISDARLIKKMYRISRDFAHFVDDGERATIDKRYDEVEVPHPDQYRHWTSNIFAVDRVLAPPPGSKTKLALSFLGESEEILRDEARAVKNFFKGEGFNPRHLQREDLHVTIGTLYLQLGSREIKPAKEPMPGVISLKPPKMRVIENKPVTIWPE